MVVIDVTSIYVSGSILQYNASTVIGRSAEYINTIHCNAVYSKKRLISRINTLCFNRHEDGTVRFWDASGVALTPIYKLSTANVFHTDCDPCDDPQDPSNDPDMQQEEEWPPFRKVRAYEEG